MRGTTDRTTDTRDETADTPDETPEPSVEESAPSGEAPEPTGRATDPDGKATEPEDEAAGPSDEEAGAPADRGRLTVTWRRAALATGVVALLLGGSAFFYGAHQLRSTPAARNQALTDAAATARVGGDVGEGLARIFSYTPARTDAAERSAGNVLGGRAARQYEELFAQVRASLVQQKITLSTQAVRTGVIELDGTTARLLVFLDQTSRRDGAAATSAAAQLTVTAEFRGDRWLIVDIKAR
ncbi:hypothetical protein ASE09_23830 [Streptomyces sp. Root66D1]|nr:hypothetical protein ASD33_27020 [Streptomyces sp. Root1304]KRA98896.1 hypothetical protein ASE09_23830 [Streptomyces sp. Root66D1]